MVTKPLTVDQKTPTRIDVDLKQHQIRITWADGYLSVYPLDYLRQICPCAVCHELRNSNSPLCLSQPEQITPCAELRAERPVTKVGSYALQFFWADDHNIGIYGFEFLRQKSFNINLT
jgi:DUF971 family protein